MKWIETTNHVLHHALTKDLKLTTCMKICLPKVLNYSKHEIECGIGYGNRGQTLHSNWVKRLATKISTSTTWDGSKGIWISTSHLKHKGHSQEEMKSEVILTGLRGKWMNWHNQEIEITLLSWQISSIGLHKLCLSQLRQNERLAHDK